MILPRIFMRIRSVKMLRLVVCITILFILTRTPILFCCFSTRPCPPRYHISQPPLPTYANTYTGAIAWILKVVAKNLTRWDALFFTRVADKGYVVEQYWAFGYGWTQLMSYFSTGEISAFPIDLDLPSRFSFTVFGDGRWKYGRGTAINTGTMRSNGLPGRVYRKSLRERSESCFQEKTLTVSRSPRNNPRRLRIHRILHRNCHSPLHARSLCLCFIQARQGGFYRTIGT